MENKIEGLVTINRIIYPANSEGGCWGIVSAELLGDVNDIFNQNIILKGDLPEIHFGQTYKVVANEVEDKYGISYQIQMMLPYNDLKDTRQWKLFLSTIISPNQVEHMFDTLDNPIKAIEDKNIKELCKVKGIKTITAEKIIKKYEENKIYGEAFAELVKYEISVSLIKKIVDAYEGNINKALNVIRTNPYQLAIDVDGIGFETADNIGKKIGIPNDSVDRIKSFIYYWLLTQAPEGNSWVTPNMLCEVTTAYLNINDMSALKQALISLRESQKLLWDTQKNYVCLKKYYDLELNIVNELKRLNDTKKEFIGKDFDLVLRDTEIANGYSFIDEQINAAKNVIKNPISIVVGRAGTGKSTSSKLALDCLKEKYNINACSFSGKASYRIYEATGFKGATIHSTLGYNPQFRAFKYNEENQLSCDVMLIDECSFLDEELFYSLLKALPNGCKLIMLGDPNQLEPIGIGSLLTDMINSNMVSINYLTKIHRQAAKSGIIVKANEVSEGIQITNEPTSLNVYGELQDLAVCTAPTEKLQALTLEFFKREYFKYNDIEKVQGLSTLRTKGNLSLQVLNEKIQEWYNPNHNDKIITVTRNGKPLNFKIGDKVINTKNNYGAIKYNTEEEKTVLYNGMTGIIVDIIPSDKSMIIDFGQDIGQIYIENDWIQYIELAYFCTIFKYQGSECDSCVISLDMSAYTLLTRNLIYTGLTRAKKNCILVCENKALRKAIATNNVVNKQTFLKDMMIESFRGE